MSSTLFVSRAQKYTIAILVLVLALLGFFVYERLSPHGIFAGLQNDLKTIQTESVSYLDIEGNVVDLTQFKGRPLIINSWASWVPFSKDELKLLEGVQDLYGEKIVILAINRKEDTAVIKSYLSAMGISGKVLFLVDPIDNFYNVIGGFATPETVFYNSDGTMREHKRGVLTESELYGYIDALIAHQ